MRKIFLLIMVLMMIIPLSLGASLSRDVNGNTISYSSSGTTGRYGGIITETIPSGYSFGNFQSGLDYKITGNQLEIPFTSTSLPVYTLVGSGEKILSGSYLFADNQGSGAIQGDTTIGSTSGGDNGGGDNGGNTGSGSSFDLCETVNGFGDLSLFDLSDDGCTNNIIHIILYIVAIFIGIRLLK